MFRILLDGLFGQVDGHGRGCKLPEVGQHNTLDGQTTGKLEWVESRARLVAQDGAIANLGERITDAPNQTSKKEEVRNISEDEEEADAGDGVVEYRKKTLLESDLARAGWHAFC